jgi:hypothetical protein
VTLNTGLGDDAQREAARLLYRTAVRAVPRVVGSTVGLVAIY